MDIYDCLDCGAHFDESQQTDYEYKNGICPICGGDDIKPVAQDVPPVYEEIVRAK